MSDSQDGALSPRDDQIRSKAQVSKSEHKSDYNAASISNTALTLEFPSQGFVDQDFPLITSKLEACTGLASYLIKGQLAYTCAYIHDMLYA